jgi:hypothetical protein
MQLRKILREQIAGMDINEEAVRVAAFSLYLAFLHYQKPREINDERRLPYLKWVPEEEREQRERRDPGAQFFDILLHANSFEAISGKYPAEVTQRFGPSSAAVVVGNPPWGYPKPDDQDGRKAVRETMKWCDAEQHRPVGDKELSQAFIHLALALLQDGGRAGLLVSSGIFFKNHKNSRHFRRVWLKSARLEHVANFAHVRLVFFSGPQREAKAVAPFASVVFGKAAHGAMPDNQFQYWSAKRTATIENTQCVVLNRGDMHWLSQRDCIAYEKLWKIYWWGGHRDESLIRSLECRPKLTDISKQFEALSVTPGLGFLEGNKKYPRRWLGNFKELPVAFLTRYGSTSLAALAGVPSHVARRGVREVFEGSRLLIRRGIPAGGQITVRHETNPFCFRHSIIGFRLKGFEPWQEKTLVAIYWSSLAQYYFFSTAGSWGMWHDELLTEAAGEMPICFPDDATLRARIAQIVGELQSLDLQPGGLELAGVGAQMRLPKLEHQLNEAIFDLYGLNAAERDLVRDMCSLGLDLFYRHEKSDALQEVSRPETSTGVLADVKVAKDGLGAYLRTFLEVWNHELEPDREFAWRVIVPTSRAPLLMVRFTIRYKNNELVTSAAGEANEWHKILAKLGRDSRTRSDTSRIFVDTFFRYVSSRELLFIKRNEQRFWTQTAAREDAGSALAYLMNLETAAQAGKE